MRYCEILLLLLLWPRLTAPDIIRMMVIDGYCERALSDHGSRSIGTWLIVDLGMSRNMVTVRSFSLTMVMEISRIKATRQTFIKFEFDFYGYD